MFSRATEVLKESNIHENCFSMQFAVYRNYSSKRSILDSPWESSPQNIHKFMQTISVQGG
jgi:hypothetical protein